MKILSDKSRNREQYTISNNNQFKKKSTSEIVYAKDNRASQIAQKKDIGGIKKSEIKNHTIYQFVKNIDGKEIPAKLYHVTTPANWILIQQSGLGFPERKLWLSSTKGAAVSGTANLLLEIDTTGILTDKIRLANDYIEGYGDNKVWIYFGRLKVSRLSIVS